MRRKAVLLLLLAVSTAGAFATLGDGKMKSKGKSLFPTRPAAQQAFTLKSTYNYRGNQVINNSEDRFIMINTVVTYQRGRTIYTLPIKRKVLLDKIKFNPNSTGNY